MDVERAVDATVGAAVEVHVAVRFVDGVAVLSGEGLSEHLPVMRRDVERYMAACYDTSCETEPWSGRREVERRKAATCRQAGLRCCTDPEFDSVRFDVPHHMTAAACCCCCLSVDLRSSRSPYPASTTACTTTPHHIRHHISIKCHHHSVLLLSLSPPPQRTATVMKSRQRRLLTAASNLHDRRACSIAC